MTLGRTIGGVFFVMLVISSIWGDDGGFGKQLSDKTTALTLANCTLSDLMVAIFIPTWVARLFS